jgi:hypothetical protein
MEDDGVSYLKLLEGPKKSGGRRELFILMLLLRK